MEFPPLLTLPEMAAKRVRQNFTLTEVDGENSAICGFISDINSFEQSSSVSKESPCGCEAADPAKLERTVVAHKCAGRCNRSTW